jgi:hypothetical protein
VGLYASNASAQCSFNTAPAKGVSGSLVRNYAPCPGTEHPSANTSTEGGTDACTPVVPAGVDGDSTLYSFSSKGKCTIKTSAKLESDCSAVTAGDGSSLGLEAHPCHVTYVSSKCSGILGTDGVTPIGASDDGFALATLSRATVNDATNGDMTIIDFPVTFNYSTPSKGGMEVASSSAEALVPLVGVNNADLPACTQIEVVNVIVKDPAGLPFAKLGQATKPK